MSEFTDDAIKQGMASAMVYGFVADPPWGPEHRCPGCQARPDDADEAKAWDTWRALDVKWQERGERSSCPTLRGETLPARIERVLPAMPDPRAWLAPTTPPVVAPVEPVAAEQEGPKDEPAPLVHAVAAPVDPKPVKSRARKARAPAPAPAGQTNLF
jgi:hypothetical protein